MPKLFGTDGVRGAVNSILTVELAASLGRAAGTEFKRRSPSGSVLIARDTRLSGPMLEAALSSGLMSAGVDVISCGILPSPAIAFLVRELGAAAGAVISASHNPAGDNGIKFFGGSGFKLTEAEEDAIESLMSSEVSLPRGESVGSASIASDVDRRYIDHCLKALEGRSLEGLKIVLDCANGAAYRTSPLALADSGAELVVINDRPDGTNINLGCGSTNPEVVAKAVLEHQADVGLAHDGDADRLIAVDEMGEVVDGDAILASMALELSERGALRNDIVVSTVMANLGFRTAMSNAGLQLVETPVGDRHVIEAMLETGSVIGGEQSGHIIFLDYATTGDGLVTALRLLGRMVSTGKRLSELAEVIEHFPQVLVNVRVDNKEGFHDSVVIEHAIKEASSRLSDTGRVLVRPSGTENVVRVMVEAPDEAIANEVAAEIAGIISQELNGTS